MKNAWRSLGPGAALLMLLTVMAYLPALRAGFIWDDDDHFTKNPAMLSTAGLKQIWSSLAVSRYYPLTLTSFWVQRRLWGLHPLPYHAVNIALQALNAVLLWTLLRRLQVRGAWVAAAAWAVHPVNVETVAWVTELKNTQSGLFFLLALLVFLRFEDGRHPRDYALALACAVAAMLSKPSTVVLPGVMLLCAWWRRGQSTLKDLLRVTPLVAFGIGMSLLTIVEQRHHIEGQIEDQIEGQGAAAWTLTAAQRLVLAGRAVWFYAGKLLWPKDICFVYPRWELRVHSAMAWLPLTGLVLVAGTLWQYRRAGGTRAAIFGLGCFILLLLPVLGFCDVYFFQFSFVADHFQYLASIALIALVVSTGTAISQRASRLGRDLGKLVAPAVLLALGVCTWGQAHVYFSSETLWRDTLAQNPNAWLAHNNLGVILGEAGKFEDAISHYEQALRINPNYAKAHYNLGVALVRLGRVPEAVRHWEQALRIEPHYAKAHNYLGNTLAQAGKFGDAIGHYEQALRIKPDYAEAHYNLGVTLVRLGRVPEAVWHWEQALQIKPDYAEAHNDLGAESAHAGRIQEAIEHYEQALQIKPDFANAHNNLGNALVHAGKLEDAIGHYEQALRLKPDFAEAHYNLGVALEQVGRVPEAMGHYEQAVQLKPDSAKAQDGLARLRAGQ